MLVSDLMRLEQLLVSYKSVLSKRNKQKPYSAQWHHHNRNMASISSRLLPLLIEYYDRTEHPEEFLTS